MQLEQGETVTSASSFGFEKALYTVYTVQGWSIGHPSSSCHCSGEEVGGGEGEKEEEGPALQQHPQGRADAHQRGVRLRGGPRQRRVGRHPRVRG